MELSLKITYPKPSNHVTAKQEEGLRDSLLNSFFQLQSWNAVFRYLKDNGDDTNLFAIDEGPGIESVNENFS